jgi:RNA polymerase sigma-70 factor (ECF subfamily)
VTEPDSEQAWVRGAQAGSPEDFGRLVRLHQQALRAFLRRLCGNHAEADDLAQETFVRAWAIITRCDPVRQFRPWLFGIAWRKYREGRRSWLRLLRRQAAYVELQDGAVGSNPDLALDLAAAMKGLPSEQKAALLLCLGCDFSHGEAAEALSLPLGTVKSHITRGRTKLAAFLGETP